MSGLPLMDSRLQALPNCISEIVPRTFNGAEAGMYLWKYYVR